MLTETFFWKEDLAMQFRVDLNFVAQGGLCGLKLAGILLARPPEHWDYRCTQSHLIISIIFYPLNVGRLKFYFI